MSISYNGQNVDFVKVLSLSLSFPIIEIYIV